MDETNYLTSCEQSEYEALLSLALSTDDQDVALALEEASYEHDN